MQVCTGKGAEKLLRKVNTNEDDELFAQRLKLTQIVTPSICHTITTPHYEMARVTPLTKSVVHQSQEVQDDIEDLLNGYYGGYGIDMFLCDNFLPYNTVDPNAFIITLHNENGAYSFVSKSEKNVDYKYDNNVLQYLITKTEVEYQEDGMPKMGERYTLYENGSLTTYTQVEWTPKCGTCFGTGQVERYYVIGGRQSDMCQDCNGIGKLAVEVGVSIDGNYLRTEDFRMFEIEKFDLKTPIIPCFRIGTIKDVTTDGETMVSMIDPAIPYLLKSIKTISELDVNVSLHAFLKKISYEPACQAQDCIQGKIRNGDDCKSCNGTGRLKADSAQTAIVLTLPDDPRDVISLANLAHYVELPIEVPKLLDDLVDKYEKKAIKAVYSTEIFEKSTVVATATEKLIENQAKNNTLYPLSMTYSFAYKYLSANVAHISGFKDFQVRHKFPKYLGLQSRENLVNELKTVKEAGLSGYVMEELESNYAKVLFADQQDELQRINQKKNPGKRKTSNINKKIKTLKINKKKWGLRVKSPIVAGSNPALGTLMDFWNKPSTTCSTSFF